MNILIGNLLEFFLQLVHFLAALADDYAGTGGAKRDGDELRGTFDYDAGNACFSQAGVEILTDLAVFENVFAEVASAEPVRVPATDDTKSVANRIYFLSHILIFCFSAHEQGHVV